MEGVSFASSHSLMRVVSQTRDWFGKAQERAPPFQPHMKRGGGVLDLIAGPCRATSQFQDLRRDRGSRFSRRGHCRITYI